MGVAAAAAAVAVTAAPAVDGMVVVMGGAAEVERMGMREGSLPSSVGTLHWCRSDRCRNLTNRLTKKVTWHGGNSGKVVASVWQQLVCLEAAGP